MCQEVLHVETVTPTPQLDPPPVLCVETKDCSVYLTCLDQILADELVKVAPSSASDLPEGQYFTCSRSIPPTTRTGKGPHKASIGISYDELPMSPEDKSSKHLPKPIKPSRTGPSQDRIDSRAKSTVDPEVCLPDIKTDPPGTEDSEVTLPMEEEPPSSELTKDDILLAE